MTGSLKLSPPPAQQSCTDTRMKGRETHPLCESGSGPPNAPSDLLPDVYASGYYPIT